MAMLAANWLHCWHLFLLKNLRIFCCFHLSPIIFHKVWLPARLVVVAAGNAGYPGNLWVYRTASSHHCCIATTLGHGLLPRAISPRIGWRRGERGLERDRRDAPWQLHWHPWQRGKLLGDHLGGEGKQQHQHQRLEQQQSFVLNSRLGKKGKAKYSPKMLKTPSHSQTIELL